MTIEHSLPITELLKQMISEEISDDDKIARISYIIPQVRSLEEASQKKAKEEERERIVKILSDMITKNKYGFNGFSDSKLRDGYLVSMNILQEAIERICEASLPYDNQ